MPGRRRQPSGAEPAEPAGDGPDGGQATTIARGGERRIAAPARARRAAAALVGIALACLAVARPVGGLRAGDPGDGTSSGESIDLLRRAVVEGHLERAAIDRGLEYLSERAIENGMIGQKFPVAVTSLAGLAFLSAGHRLQPAGPYAQRLDACLSYVLGSVKDRGYITESVDQSVSRMHGHCFALLFLTQIYGETSSQRQEAIRVAVQRAIDCIVGAQSRRGGWEYSHINHDDADEASVTIGALQSLRAARNAGFAVPVSTVKSAIHYVDSCQNPDGSFRYSIQRNEPRTSFALTAAAISTLHAAGIYDSPVLSRGYDYLDKSLLEADGKPRRAIIDPFFFYGALYATQAYFQKGGEPWRRWRSEMTGYLLARQKPDGRWVDDSYGDEFATAVAVLILSVPLQYLPVFER